MFICIFYFKKLLIIHLFILFIYGFLLIYIFQCFIVVNLFKIIPDTGQSTIVHIILKWWWVIFKKVLYSLHLIWFMICVIFRVRLQPALTLSDGAVLTPHSRIWQSLVSLTSRHSGLLFVTRLDTPIPQVAEHGDQSVICSKQVDGAIGRDLEDEIHPK